jgi:hypothetical protein
MDLSVHAQIVAWFGEPGQPILAKPPAIMEDAGVSS